MAYNLAIFGGHPTSNIQTMKSNFNVMSLRDMVRLKYNAWLPLVLICIFSNLTFSANSQSTTPISFTQIPFSDPDIIAPFRGAEQWHDDYLPNLIGNPTESSTPPVTYDAYSRSGIAWWQIESSQGVYNWAPFDSRMNDAISKRRKFSFNIMSLHPGSGQGPSANGIYMTYPLYLHNLMQSEVSTSRDWVTPMSNHWVPNYNSPNFKARLTALLNALAAHISNTSYNGVPYRNAIGYVDIGIFGSWGEWNHSSVINSPSDYPSGRLPSAQSMIYIIDAHIAAFPNYPLVIPHAAYDGNRLSNTQVPPEVGYYALTASNNWGKIGWKRMNWGWTYDYINYSLEKNPTVYNGLRFDTATANRWKYALVCGEGPCGGTATGGPHPFWDVPRQVKFYHASMIGNGNWCGEEDQDIRGRDSLRMAFKLSGYRLTLEGGSMTTSLLSGAQFSVNLNWKNVGIAPVYENWNVTYELRNTAGTAVWTGVSSLKLKLFQPLATATIVQDNFTLPSTVPAGNYSIVMVVKDPNNYRYPLPIAIRGRNADGSYLLRNVTVGTGAAVNGAPVANAGTNIAITLPVNSVNLNGSASSDPDGSIASYAWRQAGGPGTASFTNNDIAQATAGNLIQGTYTFRLTVTDNQGATSTDDVMVTVNAAVVTAPPVLNSLPLAKANSNLAITLPVNTVTMDGRTSSDSDGFISSYFWLQQSGPSTASIARPDSALTTINNLVQGEYMFQLTVTDNLGGQGTMSVLVTVNAAVVAPTPVLAVTPLASIGADFSITLPQNTATLDGRASTDADGTIVSYFWLKQSGPAGEVFGSQSSATTTISNLVEGTYMFQLTVVDNDGLKGTASIVVTVKPAPPAAPVPTGQNILPVANAGQDISMVLPVNACTMDGSKSYDPDGSIVSWSWSKISGPIESTFLNRSAVTSSITGLHKGVYVYELTVTDNRGGISKDQVSVTVIKINAAPLAQIADTITISSGALNTSLNASDSYDPDGVITNFNWTYTKGPKEPKLFQPDSSQTIIANLVPGMYDFALTITDDEGAKTNKNVVVNVLKNGRKIYVPEVSIYPNPAVNDVNITIDTEAMGRTTITFYDMQSRPVMTDVFSKGSAKFTRKVNVSRLHRGTYTVVIQSEQIEKVAKLLIKL